MLFSCHTLSSSLCLQVSKKIIMEKKKVDDVLGGEDAWDNVDKTKIECEYGCGGKFAYFQQFQTRSADEPMTTFYRCVDCKKTWSEK